MDTTCKLEMNDLILGWYKKAIQDKLWVNNYDLHFYDLKKYVNELNFENVIELFIYVYGLGSLNNMLIGQSNLCLALPLNSKIQKVKINDVRTLNVDFKSASIYYFESKDENWAKLFNSKDIIDVDLFRRFNIKFYKLSFKNDVDEENNLIYCLISKSGNGSD